MDPAPPVQKRTLLVKRPGAKVGERKDVRRVEEEEEEGMRDEG